MEWLTGWLPEWLDGGFVAGLVFGLPLGYFVESIFSHHRVSMRLKEIARKSETELTLELVVRHWCARDLAGRGSENDGYQPRIVIRGFALKPGSVQYLHNYDRVKVPIVVRPDSPQCLWVNLNFLGPLAKARVIFQITGDSGLVEQKTVHLYRGELPDVKVRGRRLLKPPPKYLDR